MFESLKESNDKLTAAREAAKATFKDLVKVGFAEFFVAHPEIQAIKWKQYTPYFNDGDACVFSVHDWYAKPTDAALAPKDDEDEENGFIDPWSMGNGPLAAAKKSGAELFKLLDDEMMKGAFGDHAEVTATRDGFEVESYEHD